MPSPVNSIGIITEHVYIYCCIICCTFNYTRRMYFFADIVECDENPNACQNHATCNNTEGGFDCMCNGGFEGVGSLCLGTFCPVTKT